MALHPTQALVVAGPPSYTGTIVVSGPPSYTGTIVVCLDIHPTQAL